VARGGITVDHRPEGTHDTLIVRGELDFTSADVLRDRITAVQGNSARIVLDLSGVEYIDSTGLAQLVWAHSEARFKNWTLAIVNPSEQVRFYIERTGLDQVLPVE